MNIFNDDSNFTYLLNVMGQKVKTNDKEQQVLISNFKEKIIDYKKIKTIVPINTGDIIQYQNSNWLIISEVSQTNSIYKATMRKTHHSLKFHVKGNKIFETPMIVDIRNQSIDEGRIISLVDGKIELLIKDTLDHRKLGYSNRFILMGIAWEVEGITRELTGLIHLYCKKTEFNPLDKRDLEIAYNEKLNDNIPTTPTDPVPIVNYFIYGGDTINFGATRTYKVYDMNNQTPTGKTFSFTLETSDKNSAISVNELFSSSVIVDATSIKLVANNDSVRGYLNIIAKCNEDVSIILKKLGLKD